MVRTVIVAGMPGGGCQSHLATVGAVRTPDWLFKGLMTLSVVGMSRILRRVSPSDHGIAACEWKHSASAKKVACCDLIPPRHPIGKRLASCAFVQTALNSIHFSNSTGQCAKAAQSPIPFARIVMRRFALPQRRFQAADDRGVRSQLPPTSRRVGAANSLRHRAVTRGSRIAAATSGIPTHRPTLRLGARRDRQGSR